MSQIGYLKDFKTQMVNFIDELIEQFPQEAAFVLIRIFIKDKIPAEDVLGRFMRDCLPFKDFIDNKDETFFLNSDIIYQSYANDTSGEDDEVNRFRELWRSNQLDDDDREVIWSWMNLFFKLAISYYKKYGYVRGWEFDLDASVKAINEKLGN